MAEISVTSKRTRLRWHSFTAKFCSFTHLENWRCKIRFLAVKKRLISEVPTLEVVCVPSGGSNKCKSYLRK